MSSVLEILLISLIPNLPQIGIATAGLVVIHTRLRRTHPRAHLYGTIGFALVLANALLGVAFRAYIPYARSWYGPTVFAKMLTITNIVNLVVVGASLVLILIALISDRDSAKSGRVAA